MKGYNISDFGWWWLFTEFHCVETVSTTSRPGTFYPFFVLSYIEYKLLGNLNSSFLARAIILSLISCYCYHEFFHV